MEDLDRRFLLGGLAGVAGVAALASAARGGPLNPPGGPVASSGKTLTEVEPRIPLTQATTPGDGTSVLIITQPGSYYLTGNVAVPAGSTGISIALAIGAGVAENAQVTVDLMGFEIVGGLTGINVVTTAGTKTLALRNGRVRNTAATAIAGLSGPIVEKLSCVVEDIMVTGAGGNGIIISGGVVRRCLVEGASFTGISINKPGLIESCMVIGAGTAAFHSGTGEVTVRNCIAAQCQGSGVLIQGPGTVENCRFSGTGQLNDVLRRNGINTGARSVVRNNIVEGAPVGIEVAGTRSLVTGNIVGNASTAAYLLPANNLYGPIINLSAVATAAVNGSAAAGVLTTADPSANYVR